MTLHRWTTAACSAVLALPLAQAAVAQDGSAGTSGSSSSGTIAVTPISLDGEDINTLGLVRVGIEACDNDAALVFELDNVPDKESIDIYTGSSCSSTDRDTSSESQCTWVATVAAKTQQDLRVTINVSSLVADCGANETEKPTLWFVAVDDPRGGESVSTGYGTYAITIDTAPPEPPEDVEGGSGENEIPVSWASSETDLEGFRVYIDSGNGGVSADGGEGDCGTGALVGGQSASSVSSSVSTKSVTEATATGTKLAGDDITEMRAAIAVVAIDQAGNESLLSEVTCVDVVPTTGFWERYQDQGGSAKDGCPCSAPGPIQARNAWPIGLALSVLFARARRRRS